MFASEVPCTSRRVDAQESRSERAKAESGWSRELQPHDVYRRIWRARQGSAGSDPYSTTRKTSQRGVPDTMYGSISLLHSL